MYSIICCSVNPELAASLKQNIAETIGAPFEFIAFDNRKYGYGICKVYNLCAKQAQYDLLCFVHEDVRFLTQGWGKLLAPKLGEAKCGVIGFAGSTVKLRQLTGWNTCRKALRTHYVQYMKGRKHKQCVNPEENEYSPVVTLDGLCLITRREIWERTPFDEDTFRGFHCYDLDFSLAVCLRHVNYVCHMVLVEHFSEGAFSLSWLEELKRLHAKWNKNLPMYAFSASKQDEKYYERLGEAGFIRFMWQKGHFEKASFSTAVSYLKHHPLHVASWGLLLKYCKYKFRHRVH